MKHPKCFSLKMNREKSIFHFEKQNLEYIGNSVHTAEYLAFGKALLARLYLKEKVYITKLLSVYIIYSKSHALNEVIFIGFSQFRVFFWPWKLTFIGHWMNFDSRILFPWWRKAVFLLDVSIFSTVDGKKEEQKSTFQIFLKDVTEEKNVAINKHS